MNTRYEKVSVGSVRKATKSSQDAVAVAKLALEDKKALDIKYISLKGKSAYTDNILIATGSSERMVQALADNVVDYLHKAGFIVDSVEGTPNNKWVIVDAGEIVIHLFIKEARDLYNLEKLYSFTE